MQSSASKSFLLLRNHLLRESPAFSFFSNVQEAANYLPLSPSLSSFLWQTFPVLRWIQQLSVLLKLEVFLLQDNQLRYGNQANTFHSCKLFLSLQLSVHPRLLWQ